MFPQPYYKTRSVTKAMEQLEKQNAEIKGEIDELKDQMTKILEKLTELGQKNVEAEPS